MTHEYYFESPAARASARRSPAPKSTDHPPHQPHL